MLCSLLSAITWIHSIYRCACDIICNIIQLSGVSFAYSNVIYRYLTAHIIISTVTESVVFFSSLSNISYPTTTYKLPFGVSDVAKNYLCTTLWHP